MSPPTASTSTTYIEDLPPEMIRELFKYLSPEDLVVCSMVNRRWHSIHATFKLHQLAVTDYDHLGDLVKWNGSNRPIPEAARCPESVFLHLIEKPLLSNLRHLALTGSFKFDLNKLNRFGQLMHLEINILWLNGKFHLNLPKLKVLAIHRWNDQCSLSIDCPGLSTLYYHGEDANQLEVKHLETIKQLETNLVGRQLIPFKGVEYLITNYFEAISKDTLLSLPKLKELHFNVDIKNLFQFEFRGALGAFDRMKRALSEFLDEAKKLKGSDFRFTFSGFQLINVTNVINVNQIDFGMRIIETEPVDEDDESAYEWVDNEYVYLKNYDLIEPGALHFIDDVKYNYLLSCMTGELPLCFFQKFTGIEEVQVTDEVKEEAHLLWFLKSLRFLRILVLKDVELSQEFYDQLPTDAHSLVSLEFQGQFMDELQLNFDFISEFPRLSDIRFYRHLSLRSAAFLVRWLGEVKEAHIRIQSGRTLFICKEKCSKVWKLSASFCSLFETKNPEEIAYFLLP